MRAYLAFTITCVSFFVLLGFSLLIGTTLLETSHLLFLLLLPYLLFRLSKSSLVFHIMIFLIIVVSTFYFWNRQDIIYSGITIDLFQVSWIPLKAYLTHVATFQDFMIPIMIIGFIYTVSFLVQIKQISVIILIVLFLVSAISLLFPSNNPLISSFYQKSFENTNLSIQTERFLFKTQDYPVYNKVAVFVMESVSYQDLEQIPFTDYHLYTNYYTTNLDSRTSLISMLYSTFVPYLAYDSKGFSFNYSRPNMIDFFNEKGFTTEYYLPRDTPTHIGDYLNWSKSNYLKDWKKTYTPYYCLSPGKYEHSCEDQFWSEKIKKRLNASDSFFILYEFIYGHYSDYYNKIRRSRFNYSMDFVKEVINEDMLVFIVSDHPVRSYENHIRPEGYQVPLIVLGKGIKRKNVELFLSHQDFNSILLYYLGHTDQLRARDSLFTMGSTHRPSVIGQIDSTNEYFFLNEKTNEKKGNLTEYEFYDYRDYFDEKYSTR